ncbi:MAG: hypothetical protein P1P84_05645 [Deferrisomatales bacterium]|nr:hypothetical protein [Deferrisomatales bacterium]
MAELIDLLSGIAGKGGESSGPGKRGKFEASILTTYNAYLPFYEDVVLRRLVASGCQHNILLVDASDLSRSMASPTERPRLAGRAYTLVPMRAAGAFHPKVALLVGKKRARVFVGSHNATLSGFGHNRELTTQIDLDKGAEDPDAPVAQAVWGFVEAWLEHQGDALPPSLREAVGRVATTFAPWLRQPADQTGDVRFVGATPTGPSLWDLVRSQLPEPVERVTVLGPFFDREGAFLSTLSRELAPKSIAVGIEPQKVALCRLEELPEALRFHDASSLTDREGYLHAKALLVEGSNNQAVLISGSANPSNPAWTAEPARRNAEAVILHRGSAVRELAAELELSKIPSLPEIDPAALEAIAKQQSERPDTQQAAPGRVTMAAEALPEGLFLPCRGVEADAVESALVTLRDRVDPVKPARVTADSTGLQLFLPPEQVGAATYVEVRLAKGRTFVAFVHHPASIARLTRTSSQEQFHNALNGLNGENPDLATVIRLADKLIFDEVDVARQMAKKSAPASGDGGEEKGDEELGPLSVAVAETKRQQRKIRELRGGDLACVIDTLIYRLGQGLSEAAEQLVDHGPSEEEQVGAEEDLQPPPPEPSQPDLAKICHGKVRTLVTRMLKQLDKADPKAPKAHRPVEQLLAVLAVLREVRAQDRRLAPVAGGESLVPLEQRKRLLEGCLPALFGRKKRLFDAAAKLFEDDPNNDLARLLGLLIWLAWDSGLDLKGRPTGSKWDLEARREALVEMAKLLEIAAVAGRYVDAFEEAKGSVWRTCKEASQGSANRWVSQYQLWARSLAELLDSHESWEFDRTPAPGDFAVAIKEPLPRLRLVLGVSNDAVRLAEFGEKKGEVTFGRTHVRAAAPPSVEAGGSW